MRRKEKEIVNVNEKIAIIESCKVCRLALLDGVQPYIIPLNYGYSFENNVLTLYFHSASVGKKLEIIRKNNRACFEIDDNGQLIPAAQSCRYGYKFQSVIGTGKIIFLDTTEEKITALTKLMQHQTGQNKPITFDQTTLNQITVYKMIVEQFTGKRNHTP
ncbi:MAG: pyridoxamine 5'-phosphate oxidase family protein [Planctomycetaceae bacterium]|jgi:nitroimidazol reductase NimA-like FMN-containing flavoprotein (pyridoxamine 5'-phosphate oxidase superfamily)|nr:pyridoxamine 5'-phosphate oxidase family protein [Planctomycetaceae bacterium]